MQCTEHLLAFVLSQKKEKALQLRNFIFVHRVPLGKCLRERNEALISLKGKMVKIKFPLSFENTGCKKEKGCRNGFFLQTLL